MHRRSAGRRGTAILQPSWIVPILAPPGRTCQGRQLSWLPRWLTKGWKLRRTRCHRAGRCGMWDVGCGSSAPARPCPPCAACVDQLACTAAVVRPGPCRGTISTARRECFTGTHPPGSSWHRSSGTSSHMSRTREDQAAQPLVIASPSIGRPDSRVPAEHRQDAAASCIHRAVSPHRASRSIRSPAAPAPLAAGAPAGVRGDHRIMWRPCDWRR